MKKIIIAMTLSATMTCGYAAGGYEIYSPDSLTVVTVAVDNGASFYTVSHAGKTMVDKSPLGMTLNVGDYTGGISVGNLAPVESVTDNYKLPNIKNSNVSYVANKGVVTFLKDDKPAYDVIFQVSDNNVAFRYKIYPREPKISGVVEDEITGFNFPEGTTTFLCPQSEPMKGFASTSPSYETPYTVDDEMGKNGWGHGYTFPCLFRVGDNGWVLVSETGVGSNYCGGRLVWNENSGGYKIGFPQSGEMNGLNSVTPGLSLPGYTPWRLITVGGSLAPIVETTAPFDVVEPLYEPSQDYLYGKGSWSWIIGMDPATNFDEQIRYIDFTADMGYQSVLVDALWDTQIGREGIRELADYAKEKNVALYLWYNSNGYWNDAWQGPRNIMDNTIQRRKEMKWMKDVGIRGIKVDFFGGDKQAMMKLYEDILSDANDYGLLVIFHGCTLPRGWERMYPNYAASEAVLASENLHFSQGSCDAEAFNATIHPFIRNAVGSMDFGGSALNKFYNASNAPGGSRRITSDVFALATSVLFQSPVQHFALAPNNLYDAPEWAVDFMKQVPTQWDYTRFIDGYPGKYVVLARRSGDMWYLAGVNASDSPVEVLLDASILPGSELTVYSDDKSLNGSVKGINLGEKGKQKVVMPQNGGVVVTFKDKIRKNK